MTGWTSQVQKFSQSRFGSLYLYALVLTVVAAKVGQYAWQYVWLDFPSIKGHSPGIWIVFVGLLLTAVFWLTSHNRRLNNRWFNRIIALLAFIWLVFFLLTLYHQDLWPLSVLTMPVILFGLWWKPPSAQDFVTALKVLAWALILIIVTTRALELMNLIPMVDVGSELLEFETSEYWLPLAGSIGPEGRWPGPMGHNSQTANVAVMVTVFAFGLKGNSRYLLLLVGITTMLMTSSRTSFLALIVGLAILIVLGNNFLTRLMGRRLLVTLVVGAGVALTLFVMIQNSNLTGRTTYWSLVLEFWRTSPIVGVGSDLITETELVTIGNNAHNQVLDALLKFGLLGAILISALFVIALVVTIGASRRGTALPLALLATYLVIGLGQADQGWTTPSVMWLWFVIPLLWAARLTSSRGEPLLGGSSTEPDESPAGQDAPATPRSSNF